MKNRNNKITITPQNRFNNFNLFEVLKYRDLIFMFMKRDFIVYYKQTLLGPLWYFIQPLVNTLVFTVIFGKLANMSTDNLPQFLFYMSGTILWAYFSACVTTVSNTFLANRDIFSKVYFPRASIPLSNVIFSFLQFFLQFFFFLCFYLFFYLKGSNINPNINLLYFPLLLLFMVISLD